MRKGLFSIPFSIPFSIHFSIFFSIHFFVVFFIIFSLFHSGPGYSKELTEKALFNSLFTDDSLGGKSDTGLKNFGNYKNKGGKTFFILTPRLNASCRDERIYLKDIFKISMQKGINESNNPYLTDLSAFGSIWITTSAAPGHIRKIEPSVIYSRFRIGGVSENDYIWQNPGTVYIERPSRIVESPEIKGAIERELKNICAGYDYELEISRIPDKIVIPDHPYEIRVTVSGPLSRVNSIRILIVQAADVQSVYSVDQAGSLKNPMDQLSKDELSKDELSKDELSKDELSEEASKELAALTVRVNINFFDTLLTAGRIIYPDEEADNNNTLLKRVRINPDLARGISDLSLVSGLVSSRKINPGTALRMDMFQKPLLVRGNQKINLISKVGNVTVRLSARALSNGAHGDTVKVITEATDKIITACVTGPGLVSAVN